MRGQLLGTVATAWQCGRYRADCSELLALRAATAGASLAFRAKAVARCETEWWKRSVIPRLWGDCGVDLLFGAGGPGFQELFFAIDQGVDVVGG